MTAVTPATKIPDFALVGLGRQILRCTDGFLHLCESNGGLGEEWHEVEQVVNGHADHLLVTVDGLTTEVDAVTDAQNRRGALLTVIRGASEDDPPNALLAEPLDASGAMVYLKDPEGRYLRVNRRFAECLNTSAERLSGHTDAELPPRETIDGPRLERAEELAREPVQLEYIVEPFDDRPALTVMRFAVRDRTGEPVAVCGVAGPVSDPDHARTECSRLMQIERWSRLDAPAVRAELMAEWGVGALLPPRSMGSEEAAVDPHEIEALRRRIAALHEASAAAARRAHELMTELAAERDRADALEVALEELREHLEDAEAPPPPHDSAGEEQIEAARAIANASEAEMHQWRERAEVSATALEAERLASEALRGELEATREQLADSERRAHEAEIDAAQARADLEDSGRGADEMAAALDGERRVAEELRSELRSEHGKLEELAAALEAERQASAAMRSELEAARSELEAAREELEAAREELEVSRDRLVAAEQGAEDARARIEEREAELQSAQGELEDSRALALELRARAEQAESEAGQLRTELEALRRAADGTTAALDAERQGREAARAELEDTRAQVGGATTELQKAQAELEEAHALASEWRARAEQAEANASVLEEHRRDDQSLRAELDDARMELSDARMELGGVRAELDRTRSELGAAVARADQAESEALAARLEGQPAATAPADVLTADTYQNGTASNGLRWSATAQRTLAGALSEASEWRTGLKEAVKVLGSEGGWDAVTAWSLDARGSLRCAAMWIVDDNLSALETLTWQLPQTVSAPPIAEALQGSGASWLGDVVRADNRHLREAATHGVCSAVLVPIRDGAAPVGLLEFLTRGQHEPDEELLASLEAVALQLGHFAQLIRLGATPHWRTGRL